MLLLQARRLLRPRGFPRLNAIAADGSNDWLSRTSALSGLSDGKKGTVETWFRLDGGNAATRRICAIAAASIRFHASLNTGNAFIVQGVNSGGSTILDLRSVLTTFTAAAAWRHVVCSWDLADANKRHVYVDAAASLNAVTYTSGDIVYSAANVGVAADQAGTNKFTGALGRVFFHADYIDLSVAANLALFRTPDGRPADLGDDGSKPFGVAPALFMRSAGSIAGANSGGGGDFTVNGAYGDAEPPGV